GNLVIAEDVVDACAQREDDLQIGQVRKRTRLLLPDKRILNGRIVLRAISHHRAVRRMIPKRLQPDFRVPVCDCQKDVALIIVCRCFVPPSVASLRNAAAINASVQSRLGSAKTSFATPYSTALPLRITSTSFARARTNFRSWLMKR